MDKNVPPITSTPNDLPEVDSQQKKLSIVTNQNKKLILFVAIISVLIAVGATSMTLFQPKEKTSTIPKLSQDTEKNISTKGSIYFEPAELTLPDKSLQQTSYVVLDAGDQKVSEVKFTIQYETGGIENVAIKAFNDTTSALGQSLQIVKNDFYPKRGVSYLKFNLKDGYFEQKGKAILAEITFTTKKVVEYSDIDIVNPTFSFLAGGETFKPFPTSLHITSSVK